jgi:hypothetical protein
MANFEEVAILRPTNGIIFPGALVIGDENMLDGAPTPFEIGRAPVSLRIDLPAGAHEISFDVDYRSLFDWFDLFTNNFSVPTKRCYKVWGTLFDRRYSTITCN